MAKDWIVREGETRMAKPIARAVLRDLRLSWGARGLFHFLWDCPNNWSPRATHLAKMGLEGERAVRTLLKELVKVGAMRLEVLKDDQGMLAGTRWVLRSPHLWAKEAPLTGAEVALSAVSASAKLVKRPPKVFQDEGSLKKKEEHSLETSVERCRKMGLLINNQGDIDSLIRLLEHLGGRLDLIRNAIAIVRGEAFRNRPYVSTVAQVARKLLTNERYQDRLIAVADVATLAARKSGYI